MASSSTETSFHRNYKTSKERDAFLFNKEYLSDCALIVDYEGIKTKIPCHKYILGGCSWEFYNIFMESRSTEIPINGISLDTVKMFVEYIYKEEQPKFDVDNVLNLLKLAKRFGVQSLDIFSEEFLNKKLVLSNVFTLIEKSFEFGLKHELLRKCICLALSGVTLQNNIEFLNMSIEGLTILLQSPMSNLTEIEIFNSANQWAIKNCEKQSLAVTSDNKRLVLGAAFNCIRFGSMELKEFVECTEIENMLTDKEFRGIVKCIGSNGKIKCAFDSNKRLSLLLNYKIFDDSMVIKASNYNHFIFKVNKTIDLLGFITLGLTIKCSENVEVIVWDPVRSCNLSTKTVLNFDGTPKGYAIFLDQPLQLIPDVEYAIMVVCHDSDKSYFSSKYLEKEYTFHDGVVIIVDENTLGSISELFLSNIS